MPKKYYVVWVGRKTGVFTAWSDCKQQVDQFPQAKYKSFPTKAEADVAYSAGWGSGLKKTTTQKTQSSVLQSAGNASSNQQFDLSIYCDGGCEPNPGKAGSGVAVYRKGILGALWYGLYNSNGTNNTAELNALHQALLIAKKNIDAGHSVQILCDSQYAINCITLWAYSWKKKGWKRKTAGDIKNLELIQKAHALYEKMKGQVDVSHVKAHIGIEGNELADRMSIFAIDQKNVDFRQYQEALDLQKILSLRTG
ncbi:Ribonuclease HI-related protein 2 [hydrothermal vent metagenome]|uniref:Ribonuclease H n=1 Tax=hydrothermal vent metagenome TaxID=652676 RepID=A0A3B1DA70_9ZZZZ